jgi:hypothetical protein
MKLFAAILVTLLLTQANAHAQQLITTCGASKGKAYYLEPTKHGWVDDGISGGTLTFFRYPNGDYDLLFKDRISSRSARQDGGTVVKVYGDDRQMLTMIVMYPTENVIETFQLTLDGNGRGILIWSNLKNRSGPTRITRGMVLVADCSQ